MDKTPETTIVEAVEISKRYQMGKFTVDALKGISFKITQGSLTAFVGESGCGKTTTLNILGALSTATSGHVHIVGQDITKLGDRKLSAFRNHYIGFIFQSFNLIEVYTAYENVAYPLFLAGVAQSKHKAMVMEMLEKVGMAKYAQHRPGEMSGGQKQRVAIARALINNPKIVLADEPTANLDSHTSEIILQLIKELNQSLKTTFVIATHSQHVMQYAGEIFRLKDGLMVENPS